MTRPRKFRVERRRIDGDGVRRCHAPEPQPHVEMVATGRRKRSTRHATLAVQVSHMLREEPIAFPRVLYEVD